jgi:hypothetical protein
MAAAINLKRRASEKVFSPTTDQRFAPRPLFDCLKITFRSADAFGDYGKVYKPVLPPELSGGYHGFQLFYFVFGIGFRNNRGFEFSHAGVSFFQKR